MPRGKRQLQQRTPDTGCQFTCHYCEGDIYQVPYPELLFLLEMVRGEQISTAYQCCAECAQEVKELNAEFIKKHKPVTKQERPLREGSELPPDLQAAKEELAARASSDAKLDKVLDALAGLTQLMAMQLQAQQPLQPPVVVAPPATIPRTRAAILATYKPKRKILAPPVKTSAKSKAAKPKRVAKATAKPKPRRK